MARKNSIAPPPVEQLLDAKQVAARIGCSERQVRRWSSAGEIEHVRIGKLLRFRPAQIEAFLERNTATAHA